LKVISGLITRIVPEKPGCPARWQAMEEPITAGAAGNHHIDRVRAGNSTHLNASFGIEVKLI